RAHGCARPRAASPAADGPRAPDRNSIRWRRLDRAQGRDPRACRKARAPARPCHSQLRQATSLTTPCSRPPPSGSLRTGYAFHDVTSGQQRGVRPDISEGARMPGLRVPTTPESDHQSTCKPAALIGPSQRAISSATYLARYSGPRRSGATPTTPISLNRVLIAGVSIAAWVASFSLTTISFGAPLGRKKAVQVMTS